MSTSVLYRARGISNKIALYLANEAMRCLGLSESPELWFDRFSFETLGPEDISDCLWKVVYKHPVDRHMLYEIHVTLARDATGACWERGSVSTADPLPDGGYPVAAVAIIWLSSGPEITISEFEEI